MAVGLTFSPSIVAAQQSQDAKKPEQEQQPPSSEEQEEQEDSYWEIELGFVFGAGRHSIGSLNKEEDVNFYTSPWLSGGYYNGNFFIESDPANDKFLTLGYTIVDKEQWQLNFIATPFFIGFDEENQQRGDLLTGLDPRTASLDAGLDLSYSNKYGQFGVRGVHDFIGVHSGYGLSLAYGYPIYLDKMAILPSVNVTYIAQETVDYYYGIDEFEQRPDRPLYSPGSGLVTRFNFYLEYELTERTSWITFGHLSLANDAINDSPIVTNSSSYGVGMGIIWIF